jgi:DNA-binding CsgD family transcriptional regulator
VALTRVRVGVWDDAAARGWLARAERLLTDVAPGAEQGWIDLARSEGARESSEAARYAEAALDAALAAGDPDLELRALAQLGFPRVSGGEVDEGLTQLDEAMAVATSGEPADLETFADICCTMMLACERAGDIERPQQWSAVLEDFVRKYDQREIEVLRLLGEGLTNSEIAARLFISPKTAEHHVSRIFAKLGMSKRSEAAAYAVRHLEAE